MNDKLALYGGKPVFKQGINERWHNISKSDIKKVEKYLYSGDLSVIDGGVLSQFEQEFAKFIGAKYAVAYCNGTAALHAASFACGADSNSTFISSIYSYHGTILSILENRSKVILVDYEDNYFTINLDEVEKNINSKTKGIIVTHCWGNLIDYDKLSAIKKKYNLKIIVDASHAHGAKYNNINVGNIPCEDIVCFSLGKNKLMSAGELGVAVTNDRHLYNKLLFFGHPNRVPGALSEDSNLRVYSNGIGNKYRPHAIALLLGIEQIKKFPKKLQKNIELNKYLADSINAIDGFYVPKVHKKCERVYWKLHIFIDKNYWGNISNERIIEAIKAEGLKLEQFHNYSMDDQLKIWNYERYHGQVINKSHKKTLENVIVLPGYVDISNRDKKRIIKVFKKVSKMKGMLK